MEELIKFINLRLEMLRERYKDNPNIETHSRIKELVLIKQNIRWLNSVGAKD